ncbi:hypothetical protein EFW17_17440 [Halostreptopolyspora alba]|uniref:Transcription factor zinc-finger domain-containing protein n=2 Tax=Halostreptopolyspora alba TaxID=2487137 RepID=A0A3N0E5H2_9ACTN|nr:hypothetical protein EFW17_17440 [Nocardiopsaceae bacterium YIM 96095]
MPPGNQPPPGPGITCPKCAGLMRHYNRNGVGIEQCDGCRGMFLDHGELETLKANESPYRQAPGWGAPSAYPNPYPQHQYRHPHHGYHHRPKTVFEMLVST